MEYSYYHTHRLLLAKEQYKIRHGREATTAERTVLLIKFPSIRRWMALKHSPAYHSSNRALFSFQRQSKRPPRPEGDKCSFFATWVRMGSAMNLDQKWHNESLQRRRYRSIGRSRSSIFQLPLLSSTRSDLLIKYDPRLVLAYSWIDYVLPGAVLSAINYNSARPHFATIASDLQRRCVRRADWIDFLTALWVDPFNSIWQNEKLQLCHGHDRGRGQSSETL